MTEDRSSVELAVSMRARRGGECRLTALATALREQPGNRVGWLVQKACGLCLPPEEFALTVGVKVQRGHRYKVPPHALPETTRDALLLERPGESAQAALVRAEGSAWNVVAYELLVEWRYASQPWLSPDQANAPANVTIPVSWPASVLESANQDEAAFRAKVRWLMAELVLARYQLDGYRER